MLWSGSTRTEVTRHTQQLGTWEMDWSSGTWVHGVASVVIPVVSWVGPLVMPDVLEAAAEGAQLRGVSCDM